MAYIRNARPWAYYNEIEPFCVDWLKNLIRAGHIAPGIVDDRSIADVDPDDVREFTQQHFFAGLGGWSLAARLAGWPDELALCSGSCPCQPFSVAGKGEGEDDPRHLWPEFFRIIDGLRPAVLVGEQVAAAVGKDWLDGVRVDLEGIRYTLGATVVPACAVDAPHRRDRLWFLAEPCDVADADGRGVRAQGRGSASAEESRNTGGPREGAQRLRSDVGAACCDRSGEPLADADCGGLARQSGEEAAQRTHLGGAECGSLADACGAGLAASERPGGCEPSGSAGDQREATSERGGGSPWAGSYWLQGADGKSRRVEPGIRLLAHGVSGRVGQLRAYGNAIVPQVAAEILAAYLDAGAGSLDPWGGL